MIPAIVKHLRPPLDPRTEYIGRHASIRHAAARLRETTREQLLALLNDPTFPPDRAAMLLRSFERHAVFLHADMLKQIRLDVLDRYWSLCGKSVMKQLDGNDPEEKVRAVLILSALLFHLPADLRDSILKGLEGIPERVRLNHATIFTRYPVWKLKTKIKILEVLEEVDRLVGSIPPQFPFDEHIAQYLRGDLEYFPTDEPVIVDKAAEIFFGETYVPRDPGKTGTAVETMRKVLRMPEITEDQIQRVQGTEYCRRDYGDADNYRDLDVFREDDHDRYRLLGPAEVPERIRELIEWVNSPRAQALHPFIRAVTFYALYDQIHPFSGRTKHAGRFFLSKILLQGKGGLRYPPILVAMDFGLPPFIMVPADALDCVTRTPGRRTSHELIHEKRTTELILQLLCLYAGKFDVFYGRHADRGSNPHMRKIDELLLTVTRF